jgi:hypothetical protein
MGEVGLMPLFVLVGGFYMFAAMVAGRAALMDAHLDHALAGIMAKPRDPVDVERSAWMLGGACIVGASGALLAASSSLALPLFLLSSLMQGFYFLLLSPKRYDRDEAVPPEGRQQSINAYALYLIVTVFVAWAVFAGHLKTMLGANNYVLSALSVVGCVDLGVS